MRTTPLLCIRRESLTCMGGSNKLVAECETQDCALHSYHFGKRPLGEPSALKAIKAFCLACTDSDYAEVKNYTGPCHLHFYRLGKNPKLKGKRKVSPKSIEALKKYRMATNITAEKQPNRPLKIKPRPNTPPRESQTRVKAAEKRPWNKRASAYKKISRPNFF